MEHYEVRVLNGVTVATPRKKPDGKITVKEKTENKKNKSPKKGTNNEEGD